MIKQIKLHDWKSFDSAQLYIDPLTILIGTNAGGKSNILDALIFLGRISSGQQFSTIVNGDVTRAEGVRGGAEWMIRRGAHTCCLEAIVGDEEDTQVEYHYTIELSTPGDRRVELVRESLYRNRLTKTGKIQHNKRLFETESKTTEGPGIATYVTNNKQGRGRRFDLRRDVSVLSQIKTMQVVREVVVSTTRVLDQLSRIFVYDPVPSMIRGYARLSDQLQKNGANIAGVLAALDSDTKLYVESQMTNYLRQLPERDVVHVYSETVGKMGNDAMLYCEESFRPGEVITVDARGMSDGTLRFVAIMTAVLTLPAKSLLVIEEIDNGLHPSRADLLVQFLNTMGSHRNVDIICTTHNPALLNAFGNRMIPFISVVYRDDDSGCSQIKLLEEVEHLTRLMARGKVGTLLSRGAIEEAVH